RDALLLLPELYGDEKIFEEARKWLPNHLEIKTALDELEMVGEELSKLVDTVAFDLADLRGYHYHTGMVFAAYSRGCSNAIALGGRYDEIGRAFGRSRPATGFSMDLRELSRLVKQAPYPKGIRAPYMKDNEALDKAISTLRDAGKIVIVALPGQQGVTLDCDRQLILRNGEWVVEAI
ncbi:MAG: ATP phosphoribosyltransferase regulatory subunit, partial [Nitrosomonas sp.]|nr:ATP phosphoribosyltransferase regulatory subunit [Nitrosomonas sp.]